MAKKVLEQKLPESFEEALDVLESKKPGIKEEFQNFSQLKNRYSRRMLAEFKLMVIIEVLNGEWVADFTDCNQRKWFPWFSSGGLAGLGCVHSAYAASHALTAFGSRLCCKDEPTAEYVGRNFIPLYTDMLLG